MLMHDLIHANVCQMVGACWDRQLMALVMEFCANGSVDDLLKRDEQSLEHLAEADLAYLEMVRTKSDLHHPTAGETPSFVPPPPFMSHRC